MQEPAAAAGKLSFQEKTRISSISRVGSSVVYVEPGWLRGSQEITATMSQPGIRTVIARGWPPGGTRQESQKQQSIVKNLQTRQALRPQINVARFDGIHRLLKANLKRHGRLDIRSSLPWPCRMDHRKKNLRVNGQIIWRRPVRCSIRRTERRDQAVSVASGRGPAASDRVTGRGVIALECALLLVEQMATVQGLDLRCRNARRV